MVTSLTPDSIRQRRAAVERQIRDTEQSLASLRSAIADLDAAERVFKMFNPQSADLFAGPAPRPIGLGAEAIAAVGPLSSYGGGPSFSSRNPFRVKTNKAYIWEVLDQATNPWMNANQIQERASAMKGEAIPMVSISPMLSDMKGDYIERDNLLVALKSRLNENGEAEASPDDDEVTASSGDQINDLAG